MKSWKRILALSGVIAGLIVSAGSAPIVLYQLEQVRVERANRPDPHPATVTEQREILRALLKENRYLGVPPPPPKPGERWEQRSRGRSCSLLHLSSSVFFCRATPDPKPNRACIHSHVEEALGDRTLDTKIPVKLRLELVAGNRTSVPIPDPRTAQALYRPLSEVERALAGPDWWHDFYRVFPGTAGLLQASRAVLSDDRTHALIYVAHTCDGLCGTGAVYELAKDGAGWRVIDGMLLWMS